MHSNFKGIDTEQTAWLSTKPRDSYQRFVDRNVEMHLIILFLFPSFLKTNDEKTWHGHPSFEHQVVCT